MKKYLLSIALILSMTTQISYGADLVNNVDDLETMFEENFYESPSSIPMPKVEIEQKDGSNMNPVKGMPLFKKMRIKVTNHFREKEYKKSLELIEQEKREQAKLEQQEQDEIDKELGIEKENVQNSKDVTKTDVNKTEQNNSIELSGGVKRTVAPNDVMLDADNIDYDEKTFDVIATGSPVLVFPPQKVTVKADKMVYNNVSNILKAYGSVQVIRDGNTAYGDYMQINMNEEEGILDNLNSKASNMTVNAKKAEMKGDKIILHDGKIASEDSYVLNFHTRFIGGNRFDLMMVDEDEKSSLSEAIGETAVKIKTKELLVNAKKNNDVITFKDADIKYGDIDLFHIPSVTVHTDKSHNYFDGNFPELGSRGRLGMFAGPGFVFDTPLQNGSILKVMPIINKKDDFGFGGMLKYRSATNFTNMAYGSGADAFVLKGRQRFDDRFYMQYGSNSFMDEWWFGPRMSKYNVELIYRDKGVAHSTIGENLDLRFRHRFGFGYMQNSDYNRHGEHFAEDNMGTTRTRYMAEVSQDLFHYIDKENLYRLDLSLIMQGSAALYGTGDTQFVGRIGPNLRSQYKHWLQDITFFSAAYQDGTPMQMYDMYRYGHANLRIREAWRVNKYVTLAWSGTLTLTDDSPNGDMCQENSFILAFGPDDFKVNIGYDWVRQQTYFALVLAMDTKGSSIDFEKMEIKNPDRLAKNNEKEVKLKVFDNEDSLSSSENTVKKMMYAEVIDLEDPDKEQI